MRVDFAEVELQDHVQQAGGKWNRRRKVYELRHDHVVALKLEARMVEDKASNSRYQRRETKHLYVDAQAVSTSRCLHLVLDACI